MSEETAGFGEELPKDDKNNMSDSEQKQPSELTLMDLMGVQGELRVKLLVAGMPNNDATGKLAANIFQDFIDGPLASKEAKRVLASAVMTDSEC